MDKSDSFFTMLYLRLILMSNMFAMLNTYHATGVSRRQVQNVRRRKRKKEEKNQIWNLVITFESQ